MLKRLTIIFCFLSLALTSLSAQEIANFSRSAVRVVSPDIQTDQVSFNYKADYATVVKLSTSWSGVHDMVRGENNVWSVTLPLPEPEIYTYNFIVDGSSVNDPQNILVQRDGTRFLNMLLVEGGTADFYKEANQRGTVSHPWFESKLLGISRRLTVYTPYGYEQNKKTKYPVLYLLHGGGGDEEAWASMGRAVQIFDNLIEKGLAKPMIVVMPNGNANQQAAVTLNLPNSTVDTRDSDIYERSFIEEMVPFIDANFRTIAKRTSRAVSGLSMGGGQSFTIGLGNRNIFANVGTFSTGMFGGVGGYANFDLEADAPGILSNTKQFNADLDVFYISCGEDDPRITYTTELVEKLTAQGVELKFSTYPGNHVWAVWRKSIFEFAQLIFK